MKKLFTALFLLMGLVSFSQSIGTFRYDSTKFEKIGGNNELIILNGTRNVTGGVLTNLGNGRTAFVTPSGGGSGSGIGAVYAGYGIFKVNDSTLRADTTVGVGLISWPRYLKLKDSIASIYTPMARTLTAGYGISGGGDLSANRTFTLDSATAYPHVRSTVNNVSIGSGYKLAVGLREIKSLTAGTNVTLDSSVTGEIEINAAGDPNWVFLSDYGTPNDGLSDTAAIKAAVATGKNVYVTPGVWLWDGYRCEVLKGQIIEGYGLNSIIEFNQDITDVFWLKNDSSRVQYISFRGKGRSTYPGGETFTFSNAIYISGNSNVVQYCYFKNVKGAAITSWHSSTIYDNSVYMCSGDSNTIGVYLVLNSEYGKYQNLAFQHSRAAFVERCSGNNKWDMLNGDYADRGFFLNSPGGCNGDHGSVSNSTFNHCTTAIDVGQTQNEYLFTNIKTYFGNILLGSLDTARQVIFRDCVFSGGTITTTKAKNCQITGGAFGPNNSPNVTVSGTTGVEYCSIMNSPYQSTTCGGGASLSNPMSGVGSMIIGTTAGAPLDLPAGTDGEYLKMVSGSPAWAALAGGGDVSKVGTPVNNQVGVWTGDGTLEGPTALTFDGTTLAITGAATASTSVTSPLLIGTSSTTAGITYKASTGNASGANPAHTWTYGNNGASQAMRIDHNGTIGIGTNPSSGFKMFIVSGGNTSATGALLVRNSSSTNMMQLDDGGNWRMGNQSAASTGMMYYRNAAGGTTVFTPTAWMHLAAGTATATSAPLKFTAGTHLTTTEAGAMEFDGTHLYFTVTNGGSRFQLDQQGGMTNPMTTTGDIIYSSSGSTPARLGIGSNGQYLSVISGVPAWVSLSSTFSYGTYTPTISAEFALTGTSITNRAQYMKVGNTVTVSGSVQVNPNVTTGSSFELSVPVASDFTLTESAGGSGSNQFATNGYTTITAEATNNTVKFTFTPPTTGSRVIYYHYTYLVE